MGLLRQSHVRLSHLSAVAVMIALVGAMFVSLQPTAAHDLGECSNPEYLTQAECVVVDFDHDNDESTADVARGTWTPGAHNEITHPPSVSVSFTDSDDVVAPGSKVSVVVTISGLFNSDRVTTAGAGSVTELSYVQASGELDHPSAGVFNSPAWEATANPGDDDSAMTVRPLTSSFQQERRWGTTPFRRRSRDTRMKMVTGNRQRVAHPLKASAFLTVGEAGTGLASATLALGNRARTTRAQYPMSQGQKAVLTLLTATASTSL